MTVVDLTVEERDWKVIVTILILIKLSKGDYVSVCVYGLREIMENKPAEIED